MPGKFSGLARFLERDPYVARVDRDHSSMLRTLFDGKLRAITAVVQDVPLGFRGACEFPAVSFEWHALFTVRRHGSVTLHHPNELRITQMRVSFS